MRWTVQGLLFERENEGRYVAAPSLRWGWNNFEDHAGAAFAAPRGAMGRATCNTLNVVN